MLALRGVFVAAGRFGIARPPHGHPDKRLDRGARGGGRAAASTDQLIRCFDQALL
jgi:hypothetical protein